VKAVVKFFLYLGLIVVALYLSGCSDSLKPKQKTANAVEKGAENNVVAVQQIESGLQQVEPVNENKGITGETIDVVLYFADENGRLVPERRAIKKVPGIARATVNELCLGPQIDNLLPTIPLNTSLLDINIKDGLCTINLSRELLTNHSGGSTSENLTVYSLVNTLCQFQSIEAVQILVEGKKVSTIAGHLDVSCPLFPDPELAGSI